MSCMIAPIAGNLVIRLSITLGLGALMRGAGAVIFAGVPSGISLPISVDRITIGGVPIATDKLVAAIVAAFCIAFVGVFYRHSRTGLALQAIADDRQTAMSVGIDIDHHMLIVWVITGVISVAAGVLWIFVSGGGFGVALVGLKVFPIVIIGGLDSVLGAIIGAYRRAGEPRCGLPRPSPWWRFRQHRLISVADRHAGRTTFRAVRAAADRTSVVSFGAFDR